MFEQFTNIGKGVIKLVVLVLMMLYIISPIDLIPDVLFPIGFLDDLLVLIAGVSYLGFDLRKMIGVRK